MYLTALAELVRIDQVAKKYWTTGFLFAEFPAEKLAIAKAHEGLRLIGESIALLAGEFLCGRLVKLQSGKDDLPARFTVTLPKSLCGP